MQKRVNSIDQSQSGRRQFWRVVRPLASRFVRRLHVISRVWWPIKWLNERHRWRREIALQVSNAVFEKEHVYWIDPRSIRYYTIKRFEPEIFGGKVAGGFWDFKKRRLDRSDKSQSPTKLTDSRMEKTILTVNIGRHGEWILNDDVSADINYLFSNQTVPARVVVRHTKWVRFRYEILRFAKENDGGVVYQPIAHVELSDIPYLHSSKDRLMMIKQHLDCKGGSLLDIGANWGYFCRELEKERFDCYAVEASPREAYFLKKMKRADLSCYKVVQKSIFDYREVKTRHFDVVLALNIFHHFLKKEEDYQELIKLLKTLKMKEMFFESHNVEEDQMKGAYKNFTPEEFVAWIVEHSNLNKAAYLGQAIDGRKMFKIYSDKNE